MNDNSCSGLCYKQRGSAFHNHEVLGLFCRQTYEGKMVRYELSKCKINRSTADKCFLKNNGVYVNMMLLSFFEHTNVSRSNISHILTQKANFCHQTHVENRTSRTSVSPSLTYAR